jgi:hypothetical protein
VFEWFCQWYLRVQAASFLFCVTAATGYLLVMLGFYGLRSFVDWRGRQP